jgi:hypothetical protein
MGRGLSIRSDIAKNISIPNNIISIDLYIQCQVLEHHLEVVYNDNAIVYFYAPTSISDFTSQVIRASNGHKQMRDCISKFKINLPLSIALMETIRNSITNPLRLLSVIACCALIPFYKFNMKETNSAKWHTAKTTKSTEYTQQDFSF